MHIQQTVVMRQRVASVNILAPQVFSSPSTSNFSDLTILQLKSVKLQVWYF